MALRIAHDAWLYHKEEAPNGRLFHAGDEHPGGDWQTSPAAWREDETIAEPKVPDLVYDDQAVDTTLRLKGDTWLYHPDFGPKLFKAGDPVPLKPWSDTPGGPPRIEQEGPKPAEVAKGSGAAEKGSSDAPEPVAKASKVEIPADWEKLGYMKQRHIAVAIVGKDNVPDKFDGPAVKAAIQAELKRRG